MNFISSLLGNLNYGTILFLMLLESTVVPVPSEFVVTPAAYHAAGGNLDVFLVILFATIGAGAWHAILAGLGWYLHSIVPEDQLNDKITEYADYIKFAIIALVLLAAAYFALKYYLKRRKSA